jgi:hypothetical protein
MIGLDHGSAPAGKLDHQAAEKAVREFVALLEWDKDARATGSELAHAYGTQRASRDWPDLKPNVFGMHLGRAVAAAGGRKIKSNAQTYVGVGVPAPWRAQHVCLADLGITVSERIQVII